MGYDSRMIVDGGQHGPSTLRRPGMTGCIWIDGDDCHTYVSLCNIHFEKARTQMASFHHYC